MSLKSILPAAIIAGLAASPASAGQLSASEIMKLTPGTFHAVVKGKYKVTVTLTRDGTAVGKAQGHEDKGRWTVRGDQLCIMMPTFTLGKIECSAVIADSGWYRGRNVAFRPL
jgi:hypothetical protein